MTPTPEDAYLPLLHAIESEIARYASSNPRMRDMDMLRAVQEARRILSSSGSRVESSALSARIAMAAAACASRMGYSMPEAVMCLSHVAASVRRHRRVDGARGYLSFIADYV